ncbi:MAG TPA: alpha/beta fold hydrolase [Solirubrobacterales bacterium]|jgi:pimeloyl-ACP methyl ester carboxylesterase/DNA-binding CsgD family transcriptional regulator|nr:alpha/beta fold hydrolase [Solirubrobacterales bacterium]
MDEQEIRFAVHEGRRVAWASSGTGPPLVFSGWWMTHLELNWREPRFRALIETLGEHRTVIRYDPPGTGASADGGAPAATLEESAAALAAILDAAEAPAVDLLAGSSGAPIGLALAAARPERVARLVVYGGYASGPSIAAAGDREAMVRLVREHWGLGSRVLADLFMPSAERRERDAFVAYQREAASPEEAADALAAVYELDAADRLADVAAPAVVLHRREDRAIPFALGRELAAALPDASFVALEGADHYPWFGDVDAVARAMLRALGVDPGAPQAPSETAPPGGMAPRSDPAARPAAAPTRATGGDLTDRETEVLTLIATGLSDREIAERLVLSPHTVHRHVANVRTKLGLPTRAAAVAAAARRGLL